MKFRRRHNWLRRLILGLAVAAVAAPVAQARILDDPGITVSKGMNELYGLGDYSAGQSVAETRYAMEGPLGGPPSVSTPTSILRTPAVPRETGRSALDVRVTTEGPLGGPSLRRSRSFVPQVEVGGPQSVGVIGIRGGGQVPEGGLGLQQDPATARPPQYRIGSGEKVSPEPLQIVGRSVRPPSLTPGTSPTSTAKTAGEGTDWADAGVGFGAALGLGLLGAGMAMSLRRRRKLATGF